MYFTLRIDTNNNIYVNKHEKIDLDLKYLQDNVNGYIEIVHCNTDVLKSLFDNVLIVVDEEGLLKDSPQINKIASFLYGGVIVGDVVLTSSYNPDPFAEPDCYAFEEIFFNRLYEVIEKIHNLI